MQHRGMYERAFHRLSFLCTLQSLYTGKQRQTEFRLEGYDDNAVRTY
jgi:hypothetical protein